VPDDHDRRIERTVVDAMDRDPSTASA